jgi:hypothetical protein
MATWDFWTHGIAAIIEKASPDQIVRRLAWGTRVCQPGNTSNWFHFAITTPTQIDGETSIGLVAAYVKATVNPNARITSIHVHVGGREVVQKNGLDLRGPAIDYQLDLPLQLVRDAAGTGGGLVVSVGVEFLTGTPVGEITFTGAAARFRQVGAFEPVVLR